MQFNKSKYQDLIFNGYEWAYHDRGVHTFQKPMFGRCKVVECSEEQLQNGDIEFMTQHEWTLSKCQQTKIKRTYTKKYLIC